MGKLPYIPDKRLYAAVMGACSYVRETGYFNKAVSYYADKYSVSEEEVAKYVRMAQGKGQKEASAGRAPRKYSWFAVEYSMGNERNGGAYFDDMMACYAVRRGLSEKTVTDRMSANDDYASENKMCHWFGRVVKCESEAAAQAMIASWSKERQRKYGG